MPSTFNAGTPGSAVFYVRVKRGSDATPQWYLASSTGYHLYGQIQAGVIGRPTADRAITAADLRTLATVVRTERGGWVGTTSPTQVTLPGIPAEKKAAMATALTLAADAGRMTPRAMAILLWLALRDTPVLLGDSTEALLPADLGVAEGTIFPDLGTGPAPPQGPGAGATDIQVTAGTSTSPLVTADGVSVQSAEVRGTGGGSLPDQAKSWIAQYGLYLVIGAVALVAVGVLIAVVVAKKRAAEREQEAQNAQKRIPPMPRRAGLPAPAQAAADMVAAPSSAAPATSAGTATVAPAPSASSPYIPPIPVNAARPG